MLFQDFYIILQQWSVPVNYTITQELLESPLLIQERRDVNGMLQSMIIEIEGDPPQGHWYIRFDNDGAAPKSILHDGQLIPALSPEGAVNPVYSAVLAASDELLIDYHLEKTMSVIGTDDLERLKSFTQKMDAKIELLEIAQLAAETIDVTPEDVVSEGEGDAETEEASDDSETSESTEERRF